MSQLSPRARRFIEELRTLCVRHGIEIVIQEGHIELYPLDHEAIHCTAIEDFLDVPDASPDR